MGRKQEVKNPKFIGGDIEIEDWEALEQIRWREHKERSEIIRMAIQEFVRLHGEGNDSFKLDEWHLNPTLEAIPNLFASDEKHKKDYQTSNKEERIRRFKNAQRIIQIYKDVNFEESKR
jgi:hypothetical protein